MIGNMFENQKKLVIMNVAFKMLYEVEEVLDKKKWVSFMCWASEVAVLMYFLISSALLQASGRLDNGAPYKVHDSLPNYRVLILIISLTFLILIGFIFVIEFITYSEAKLSEKKEKKAEWLRIVLVVVVYSIYCLYPFIGYQFWVIIHIFISHQNFNWFREISFTLLIGATFLLQTVFFRKTRLYLLFSAIVPFFIGVFSFTVFKIVIFVLTVNSLLWQKDKMKILCLKMVLVTSIWSIISVQEGYFSQTVSLITLSVILSFTSLNDRLNIHGGKTLTSLKEIEKMIEFYEQEEYQAENIHYQSAESSEMNLINFQEQYLYSKYFNQNDIKILPKARKTHINGYAKSQEMKKDVILQRISMEKESNSSIQMILLSLRANFLFKRNQLASLHALDSISQKWKSKDIGFCYQIYKLSRRLIENRKNQEIAGKRVKISGFIRAEQIYGEFYESLDELIASLACFWKEIQNRGFLVSSTAEQIMQKIMDISHLIEGKVQKLSDFKISTELRLWNMMTEIIDCYKSPNNNLILEEERDVEDVNFQYLFIRDSKIAHISLKLLKELGYQPADVLHEKLDSFLPKRYMHYVNHQFEKFLEQEVGTNLTLPLRTYSGCRLFKQCTVNLVMEQNVPTFVLIIRKEDKKEAELLLNLEDGIIEGVNPQLIKLGQFNDEQEIVKQNQEVYFSSLFTSELDPNDKAKLLRGQKLVTKFFDSAQGNNKKSKKKFRFTKELEIVMKETVSDGKQTWIYLRLEFMAKMLNYLTIKNEKAPESVKQDEHSLLEADSSLKHKMFEKLSQKQKMSVDSSTCLNSFITIFLLVLFFAFIITGLILDDSTNEDQNIEELENSNNQYLCLLKLYANAYSQHFISIDPPRTKDYLNSVYFGGTADPAALDAGFMELDNYYLAAKESNVREFLSTYMLPKNKDGHLTQQYELTFGSFRIETNTFSTTFYDFISQSTFAEMEFLVQNYHNLISIYPSFEDHYLAHEKISQNDFVFSAILRSIMIIMALVVVVIGILLGRAVHSHIAIKRIYNFVGMQDIGKIFSQLDKMKTEIGEICNKEEQIQYRNTFMRIMTSFNLLDKDGELSVKQDQQEQEIKEVEYSKVEVLQYFWKLFLVVSLMAIISISPVIVQDQLVMSEQTTFSSIIALLQKYQILQVELQRNYIELFQQENHLSFTGSADNLTRPDIQKLDLNDEKLPQIFMKSIIPSENLCQVQYNERVAIPFFKLNLISCSEVEKGILAKGFGESLETYEIYLRSLTDQNTSAYLSTLKTETSTRFRDIVYMKELLQSFLSVKIQEFKQNISDFEQEQYSKHMTRVIIYSFLSGLIASMLLVFVYRLNQKRKLVAALIKMVPQAIMFKPRTLTYIRDRDIIQKIASL